MKNSNAFYICSVFTVSMAFATMAGNWPAWRGPEMTGISAERNLPTRWSEQDNVRWKVELPGAGNSTPIVWGDRVFISQAVPKDNRRTLMCFDRAEGKLRWQSGVTYTEKESTQENNPYCSGSPVTDGERIYVCFGSAGVYAYDWDGKEVWHRDLGKLNHMFGNAVSTILYENLCILNLGPDAKARLIALDKKTGQTAWEVEPLKPEASELQQSDTGGRGRAGGGPDGRGGQNDPPQGPNRSGPGGPDAANAPGGPGRRGGPGGGGSGGSPDGSWSTPVVVPVAGHSELIVCFPYRLAACDPSTGKVLWFSKGLGATTYATPLWGDGLVVAMSGGPTGGNAIAVNPGGSGDVTESQRVWRIERAKSCIGSGVIYNGHLFIIGSDGIAQCSELKTGKKVWEEPLKGAGSKKSSWSSMLLTGDKIYVPNQSGDVFVLRASPQFELIATNSVGELTNASLAASEGELFLRTQTHLWCFANVQR